VITKERDTPKSNTRVRNHLKWTSHVESREPLYDNVSGGKQNVFGDKQTMFGGKQNVFGGKQNVFGGQETCVKANA
jgi:hypothetical protein